MDELRQFLTFCPLKAKELSTESADFAEKDTEVIHECVRELGTLNLVL